MSAAVRPRSDPSVDPIGPLLARTRVIAMIGASPERWRPSFGIMSYLQSAGFRVLPVNPNHAGETLHGERVHGSLAEAVGGQMVDLVNVFRRSDAVDGIVSEVIAAGLPAMWTQVGVRDEAARRRAEAAGITVVMDRCISVEHSRRAR